MVSGVCGQEKVEALSRPCIRVSIPSAIREYSLKKFEVKKASPVLITVEVDNLTDERLQLRYAPIFTMLKIGANEARIKRTEKYLGLMPEDQIKEMPEALVLEKQASLQFTVDLNRLRVQDTMWAINMTRDLLTELSMDEYYLDAETAVEPRSEGKLCVENARSSKVLLRIR